MAKKKKEVKDDLEGLSPEEREQIEKLPPEARERLKNIKQKLEQFQKKILDKFDKYIKGIAVLPPSQPKEGEQPDPNRINVLVLVDDSDSRKMTKEELKK